MERLIKIPISSFLFGFGGLLFFWFLLFIDFSIGYPRSTTSTIGLSLVPFCIFGTLLGIIFGIIYAIVGNFIKMELFNLSIMKYSCFVGIFVVLISFFIPLFLQIKWNIYNRPRLIISKINISNKSLKIIENKIYDFINSPEKEKELNRKYLFYLKYEISFDSQYLRIKYLDINKEKTYNFKGFCYIRDIKVHEFSNIENKIFLLVYLKLRKSSKRIIYSLYNRQGKCVYQKLEKI